MITANHDELIKHHMKQAITTNIDHCDLQNLLYSFIETKQQCHFGSITTIHHHAFRGEDPEVFKLAAAVELLLLSFDIFDDLEDLDNKNELWMQMDSSIALNAATTLYTLSQQTVISLSAASKFKILQTFLTFASQAMEGQHDDLKNSANTEEEYMNVMKRKSGSLIALSAQSGMLLANTFHPEVEQYSYQIGIAAQIDNDFRDLFNPEKNDLFKEKRSLARLYLQKNFNQHARELMAFYRSNKTIEEEFGSFKAYKEKLFHAGVAQYMNVMKNISLNRAARIIDKLEIDLEAIDMIKSKLIFFKKIAQ